MRFSRLAASALAVVGIAWVAVPNVSAASSAVPHFRHIVEIMMENQSYSTIIGNTAAPQLNSLANKYGLATNYYGVTHPSEPNYVAAIGGSSFGIQDDNQFYCTRNLAATDPHCVGTTVNHTVSAPNLAEQLTAARLTWKGYFQSLPPTPRMLVSRGPDANGPYTFKYPSNSNALYASRHNPFLNFTGTLHKASHMVPDTQLARDLFMGNLPNYSLVVPDLCHDMHGTGGCPTPLISAGDTYVGNTVKAIMSSKMWHEGRNAIVITWDEDDLSAAGLSDTGCCGSSIGGGHVVTIVITNAKRPVHVVDHTAYNHYSLLKTMEAAFGVAPLAQASNRVVPMMTNLFK